MASDTRLRFTQDGKTRGQGSPGWIWWSANQKLHMYISRMQEVAKLFTEMNFPSFSCITGWPPGIAHIFTT